MPIIRTSRTFAVPPERLFQTISNIGRYAEAIPHITGFEFLSDATSGVGTRFVETRMMGEKEHRTELEVTEFVPNERVRMVADSHGTIWDTVFVVTPTVEGSRLDLAMDARAHRLLPRLLNPIMKGLYRKGLDRDMDALEQFFAPEDSSA